MVERNVIFCLVGGHQCENGLCASKREQGKSLPCNSAVLSVVRLMEASVALKEILENNGPELEALNSSIVKIRSAIPNSLKIDPVKFDKACLSFIYHQRAKREAGLNNK